MFVIDSSVFAKIFIEESDSKIARGFIATCLSENIKLIAPKLFYYEIVQVVLHYNYSLINILQLLNKYCSYNLTLIDPSNECWLKAEEIVKYGHSKSGFPSLYDSIYHALAILYGCQFITADKRHEAKTSKFGHITLLENWKSVSV